MNQLIVDNPFSPEYPAGKFFAGREPQLRQLYELLDSLTRETPSNLYIVGRGGEGKTSYLEKIVEEAKSRNLIACKCGLDLAKPAETNINTIVQSLLREIEAATQQQHLEKNWSNETKTTFRTPCNKEIIADDLRIDFQNILSRSRNDE